MTDLIHVDPNTLIESASDPGEFVVQCLERGKSWLAEALEHNDLDALANMKGYAETLRVATMQKQLGKDAELAATELVRRAERAIGLGIRAGQERGEIRVQGEAGPQPSYDRNGKPVNGSARGIDAQNTKTSPRDYASQSELSNVRGGIYDVTDNVTDEQFEEALTEAKEERNLSRANVVRHVKGQPASDKVKVAQELAAAGNTTQQIAVHLGYSREGMREFLKRHDIKVHADAVVGKQRKFDSVRIVSATVDAVNGIGMLFEHIDYSALDPEDVDGWLPVLNESIRSLTTLRNRLKEVASRD